MTGRGHSFVVLSFIGNRADYDWCGSLARAMKHRAERISIGDYDSVCIRRIRLTKSRKPVPARQ